MLEAADDAATVNLGSPWRTPTAAEVSELISGCDWTWTRKDEQNQMFVEDGWLGTSKTNGTTIFFPAVGYFNTVRQNSKPGVFIWTAELARSSAGRVFYGSQESGLGFLSTYRTFAMPIRPVHD